MHSVLKRQLKKLNLNSSQVPESLELWQQLLEKINVTYQQADEDRLLLERSLTLSSTELRDRLKKLTELEARRHVILDSSLESIFTTDLSGGIIEFNQTAGTMFQINLDHCLLEKITEILFLAQDFLAWPHLKQEEMQALRADGKTFSVEVSCVRILVDSMELLTWFIRDLSLKKQYEEKIKMRETELLHASKLASLGVMAGGIAHEINTPLSVIGLISSGIRKDLNDAIPDVEKALSRIDIIEKTVSKVAKIIGNLQHIAKDEKKMPFEQVDLNAVVEGVVLLVNERFQRRQIELTVEPIPFRLLINGRASQISQVILNLLTNALDAVEGLEAHWGRWVRIASMQTENEISLSIMDSGQGIPVEVAERIFDPFFTTKKMGESAGGIGLSIARTIMKGHNAEIILDRTSFNTKFILKFPPLHQDFKEFKE